MKLLILGATGPTGHQLVSRALEAGHSVAALVRDPRKVTETIEVIEGDATNASAVAGAARGPGPSSCHAAKRREAIDFPVVVRSRGVVR
jgi:nucleoside-diphosphate-sugar epimerase